MAANIADELLAQVPEDLRNKACICQSCIAEFYQKVNNERSRIVTPTTGDFYFDQAGLMVFTAEYHLRRGYCCGSGCRHCPYPDSK